MDKKMLYYIALQLIPQVGSIHAKNLIAYCGGVEAIFKASKNQLLQVPGIGIKTAETILSADTLHMAEKECVFIRENNIKAISMDSIEYPQRLKHCKDGPILIYYKGNCSLNYTKTLSIIGTRRASQYGKSFCNQLIKDLAFLKDICIVSGLAYGIDACVHRACLKHSIPTIGVLAHGLNSIYPLTHSSMAKDMLDKGGGLLSEQSIQQKIVPGNFPKRNRIIAGMVDAVLVIESSIKGGSMITANIAYSYNRDVMALPGAYNVSTSKGCNYLIKTMKASLVESAEDVLWQMNWDDSSDKSTNLYKQHQLLFDLSDIEKQIYTIVAQEEEVELQYLIENIDLNSSQLAKHLLDLEFKGVLSALPGKRYKLF